VLNYEIVGNVRKWSWKRPSNGMVMRIGFGLRPEESMDYSVGEVGVG
jgi:hypothetical protein